MQVTINIPDVVKCDIRGLEMPVDYTKATDLSGLVLKTFLYGHRMYNDKAPQGAKRPEGSKDDPAVKAFFKQCLENAEAIRDDYLAGKLERERAERGESADPVGVEARAIARAKLKGMDDQKRKALLTQVMTKYNEDEKAARIRIVDAIAAKPDVRAQAQANVAARADLDIDLDDIAA